MGCSICSTDESETKNILVSSCAVFVERKREIGSFVSHTLIRRSNESNFHCFLQLDGIVVGACYVRAIDVGSKRYKM